MWKNLTFCIVRSTNIQQSDVLVLLIKKTALALSSHKSYSQNNIEINYTTLSLSLSLNCAIINSTLRVSNNFIDCKEQIA